MDLSYYPGCTLHGSACDYHESILAVFGRLDVNLKELGDWSCCGASSAHVMHPQAAVELPARNLLIASRIQAPLLVPCAACFHRLRLAQVYYRERDDRVSLAISGVDVVHINDVLAREPVRRALAARIVAPLTGLKAVPYYGCLTVRPPAAVNHPRPEDPQEMDAILRLIGADVVNWTYKTDCCGGNHALTRPDLVRALSGNLFEAAREARAEIIVTDCPMCQANLDTRQQAIEAERNTAFNIPVVYITELAALAMGVGRLRSWRRKHLVDPGPLFKGKGLAI